MTDLKDVTGKYGDASWKPIVDPPFTFEMMVFPATITVAILPILSQEKRIVGGAALMMVVPVVVTEAEDESLSTVMEKLLRVMELKTGEVDQANPDV
jgi:hypothetical protein